MVTPASLKQTVYICVYVTVYIYTYRFTTLDVPVKSGNCFRPCLDKDLQN